MKIWHWRLLRKDVDIIVDEGVLNHCVDIMIDYFITSENTSADRCIWDVEKYIKEKKLPYRFEYYETELEWKNE